MLFMSGTLAPWFPDDHLSHTISAGRVFVRMRREQRFEEPGVRMG